MPIVIEGKKNMARTALVDELTKIDSSRNFDKPSLSKADAKAIENFCKDGNTWVRETYFPKRKNLFAKKTTKSTSKFKQEDV